MTRKKDSQPKIISADHKLDRAQFKTLNRTFYGGFHQELVVGRLGMLCVLHEQPQAIEAMLQEGVSWGQLQMSVDPDETSLETLKRNAELELVALRQHAAEILFRVFWVHAHQDRCPWLALARMRNPGDLKSSILKYQQGRLWASEEERLAIHARAVWGSSAADPETHAIRPELHESTPVVASWISVAADLVQASPLYNAYKHGLAVVASEPFTSTLGDSDGGVSVTMEGGSGFKYVNRNLDEGQRRYRWSLVTEPVDFEAAAGETAVFAALLGTILDAGALDRGVTEPPQTLRVHNPQVTPTTVRSAGGGGEIGRWEDGLLYFK